MTLRYLSKGPVRICEVSKDTPLVLTCLTKRLGSILWIDATGATVDFGSGPGCPGIVRVHRNVLVHEVAEG